MVGRALTADPSGPNAAGSTGGEDGPVARQPAFVGMAPRRRRARPKTAPRISDALPVAHVVLDVQAVHLGADFDYLIPASLDDEAVPGSLVRVRFGTRRVNGVIWGRGDSSDVPASGLRPLENVLTRDLVPAELRSDIEAIADAYGGTRANILRLAIPPRSAAVDSLWTRSASESDGSVPASADGVLRRRLRPVGMEMTRSYDRSDAVLASLDREGFASFVVDSAPGPDHCERYVAWMAGEALLRGLSAVAVLPDMRSTRRVARMLDGWGLSVDGIGGASRGVADAGDGPGDGIRDGGVHDGDGSRDGRDHDVVVLAASMPPAHRYAAFREAASGRARCVIGPRAAMYAPVSGRAVFIIMDDAAYQQADGMMPYAQARGVMRLRARRHNGVFMAVSRVRSALSQWECDGPSEGPDDGLAEGGSVAVRPTSRVIGETLPAFRWLNRENLIRWNDPTVGARIPRTAVRVLSAAVREGPVLFSIPKDMADPVLGCSTCHRLARCRRCTGPLSRRDSGAARCQWCGAPATGWTCRHCGGSRMAPVRVGSTGTVRQISELFPGVPIAVSSPVSPAGPLSTVEDAPCLVVAVSGFEPRVRTVSGDEGAYRAVAILDAWTSLYAQGVDARYDVLSMWMRAMSCAAGVGARGRAMLIGETDPLLVEAMRSWDCAIVSRHEVDERREAGLPPALSAACVWGARPSVMGLLRQVGALGGDLAEVTMQDGVSIPSVLGPVPIPPPRTLDARELEQTRDRVKAVIRVPHRRRGELAVRLRERSAWHVATREPGELRFALDPKDFL